MKFKNAPKKTPAKKPTKSHVSPSKKDPKLLKKEEIREVVEETIEALSQDPADTENVEKPVNTELQKSTETEKEDIVEESKTEESGSEEHQPLAEKVSNETIAEKQVDTKITDDSTALQKESTVVPAGNSVPPGTGMSQSPQEASIPSDSVGSSPASGEPGVVISSAQPVTPTVSEPSLANSNESKQISIKKLLLLAFVAFIIGFAALFAFWYTTTHNILSSKALPFVSHPQPTPTRVPQPTPTQAVQSLNLSKYTITVLNGSGISGEASKVKDMLVGAGFTVGAIGNAQTSDVTTTTISAKANVDKAYLAKLTQTLQETYTVSSTVDAADASQSSDIVVTIGSSQK